jgi:hypothetical protein
MRPSTRNRCILGQEFDTINRDGPRKNLLLPYFSLFYVEYLAGLTAASHAQIPFHGKSVNLSQNAKDSPSRPPH